MRIVRNVGLIRSRKRRTRLLIGAGAILLGAAIVVPLLASSPVAVTVAYIALIAGFFLFIYGTQQHAKWSRRPRADEAIDEQLGRFNDRYAVVHYPELGAHSPEHVIVSPGGILVLTTRDIKGEVEVRGDRWQQRKMFFLRFFNLGAPSLGNPGFENQGQVERVEEILDENALPGEATGAVVFISDDVEITMEDPTVKILHISELQGFCRKMSSDVQLSSDDRAEIVAALSVGDQIEETGARDSRPKKKIKVAG